MSPLKTYLSSRSPADYDPAVLATLASLEHLESVSPSIAEAIRHELRDQRSSLKLIASENYSSLSVQLAMGNLLTDKYAEGFPHHRFYAGCENVDKIEAEAVERLKQLYHAEYAYVQPHSGADANLVALWSILVQRVQHPFLVQLGKKSLDELTPEEYERVRQLLVNQTLMGMSLNSGGHLTHGYRHNISSKICRAICYDVDPVSEQLDYHKLAQQVLREKPTILLAGYSAHPRRLDFAKFREIADSVGAVLWVDMAHFAGLVAGGVFQGRDHPVPYADVISSTTHKTLRGPRGGFILSKLEFQETINKGCPLALGGPLPHVIAAKAIAFQEAQSEPFRNYSQRVVDHAAHLAEEFLRLGTRLVTGGTENHLLIVDTTQFGITGRQAETLLRQANINVNRNAIPFDPQGPWYTSGIRLGSPALTTLGMGKTEMQVIARTIHHLLSRAHASRTPSGEMSRAQASAPAEVLNDCREAVKDLLHTFPLYPELGPVY